MVESGDRGERAAVVERTEVDEWQWWRELRWKNRGGGES